MGREPLEENGSRGSVFGARRGVGMPERSEKGASRIDCRTLVAERSEETVEVCKVRSLLAEFVLGNRALGNAGGFGELALRPAARLAEEGNDPPERPIFRATPHSSASP